MPRINLKKLLKKYIPNFAKKVILERQIRYNWLNRKKSLNDDHLSLYWNSGDSPYRKTLLDLIEKSVGDIESNSILEFGSHVGINLKLAQERFANRTIKYFAVEPNIEAFNFMKSKLDFIVGLNVEDQAFLKASDFPPTKITVSFVNSVFYSMTPERAKAVIQKLASISQVIIIGDAMENADGVDSKFNMNPVCFMHPYTLWLSTLGFSNIEIISAPNPQPQLNGFLVAKRESK